MTKKLLCLFSGVLLTATLSFGQTKSKTMSTSTKLDNSAVVELFPLKAFYGKPMSIPAHKKGSVAIPHAATDYVIFNKDGSYIQSWAGTVSSGQWVYDKASNNVTITCATPVTWHIETVTADMADLKNAGETISYSAKK